MQVNEMDKKECGECHLPINDLEPVRCGFCESFVHNSLQCCGFSGRAHKDLFFQGKAVFFCSACKVELNGRSISAYLSEKLNNAPTEPKNAVTTDQFNQLITTVGSLSDKVDRLMLSQHTNDNLETTPRCPRINWPSVKRPTPKRRREEQSISTQNSAEGTKTNFSKIVATVPAAEKKLWIYLTRIHPDVSTESIKEMVMECMQCDKPPEVVKLVKRDVDLKSLRFISFKVGVDLKHKETALSPSTWPTGIFFREFEEYGSKNGHAVTTLAITPAAR